MPKLGRFVLHHAEPLLGLKETFLDFQREVLQADEEQRKRKIKTMKETDLDLHGFTGLTSSLLAASSAAILVHPNLGNVHWSVEALWTATLVIAIITAFACCMYYSRISMVRSDRRLFEFYSGLQPQTVEPWVHQAKHKEAAHVLAGDYGIALMNVWMHVPCLLLSLALTLFLGALVLFWGLGWLGPVNHRDEVHRIDSRNIFAVSIVAILIPTVLITTSVYLVRANQSEAEANHGEGHIHHQRQRQEVNGNNSDENALTADLEAQGH